VKHSFLLISILFLLSSCTDLAKKEHLETIDTLTSSLDSLQKEVQNAALPEANIMADSIKKVENRFKKYYTSDTVDRILAGEINDLKQSRKALSHFGVEYDKLIKGCAEQKESLRELRYDIDNADGDRKKYKSYIDFEKSKFRTLRMLSKDYIQQKTLCKDRYDRLYPKWFTYSIAMEQKAQK
jgi:hypothetical protein